MCIRDRGYTLKVLIFRNAVHYKKQYVFSDDKNDALVLHMIFVYLSVKVKKFFYPLE